jgi:glycerol uptake facilitator-like aquaporin
MTAPDPEGGAMTNRRALAELIGTFVLVFGGVGSAVIAGEAIGNLGVAFAFGLSLLAMALVAVRRRAVARRRPTA